MRRNWLAFLLLFITLSTRAQSGKKEITGIIIGNVIDTLSGKGIPSVTIDLLSLDDSLHSKSLLTDKDGVFEINDIRFGYYNIRFSAVGMGTVRIDSIHIREDRFDFNLGDVRMYPAVGEMNEVIVYAEKPLIEAKDGAIIYNVGESALSAGSSTSELLKNMPLVSTDANGRILLKGKEPKILIDDKPTDLTAEQLSDLLESMPGGLIEKIELLSNPPPQYASESGGVINIVTKKGRVGLTGRINLAYGTRGEATLSGNISYREKKLILNLTAGAGASRITGDNSSFRQNFYADSTNSLATSGDYVNKSLRPNLRITADYEFNKRNLLNVTALFNANLFDNLSETEYINRNRFDDIYRYSTRSNATTGNSLTPTGSVTYTRKGKDVREVLRFIGSFATGSYDNKRIFFQQFLNPDASPTGLDSTQRQKTNNTNRTWTLRLDYTKPLKKWLTLSTGASSSRSGFHNILNTDVLRNGSGDYFNNPLLSNDFWFYQDVHTARAAFTIDLPRKWRIVGGAQAENTRISFAFKEIAEDYANNYWNVLPNFTLRKEWLASGWSSSIIYRKSIRRPGIGQLNPSIDYNDPYNLRFGNPVLLPQLADNFDWNVGLYKGKYYVNVSAGYNLVKDIIQSIRTLIPGDKTQITYQNITDRKEYEASIFGGYTFSKKLRMNASSGYSYNVYSEYDRLNNRYRNGGTFYSSLNFNYIFTDRITLEGNIRYNSIANAQGRSSSNIKQNLGLMTKWLNKQLTVTLSMIDIFAQQEFNTVTYGKNFQVDSYSQTRTRNVRIAVAYNLKRNKQKATKAQQKALLKAIK
ncbi:MAG: hypothetical protein ABS85_03155 [Sphingobacteriales bacterium SCN 48-20]|uniref:outer membrane beta-barrel family protein n=1 Tax=Terrimonas ferruginea TaxID=249 RepID=UPI00086E3013|nr:outer membrane beta-barrel family protein [Terrimonas ferruginea]MBN8785302.1 outer membrane beta-barrel protein [Terrimonas ferruginea]ODT94537.1 MAG: hypothetical protein ABS85_03155 [Sphingobacteriales bacterium SCN 48-20]OJW40628.1 MAG: hypothetical protein BGO56_10190 [Sphingobacteriales bacterium 48-107]